MNLLLGGRKHGSHARKLRESLKESPTESLRKISTVIKSWSSPLRFETQSPASDDHPFVSNPLFQFNGEEDEDLSVEDPTFVPAMAKDLNEHCLEDCRLLIDQVSNAIEEKISEKHNEKDAFEGKKKPTISLNSYLFRLVKYMDKWFREETHLKSVGMRSLILSVIYIQHLQELIPEFELNDLNVHRLFLISMLLAAKFNEDIPISNKYWSKVGGINMKQLNSLESIFCSLTQFKLFVEDDEVDAIFEEFKPTLSA